MTAPRITIDLASHERSQLDEYIPQILDHVDIDDDEAAAVEDVTLVDNEDGTASATVKEWSTIISALRVIGNDGLRSWWLRKKLAKRLRDAEVPDAPSVGTPADNGGEAAA